MDRMINKESDSSTRKDLMKKSSAKRVMCRSSRSRSFPCINNNNSEKNEAFLSVFFFKFITVKGTQFLEYIKIVNEAIGGDDLGTSQ